MDYFIDAFRQYANFSGRARRMQYWMFALFYCLITLAIGVIELVLGTLFIGAIFSLVVFVPSVSITARRLHDTGRSGWWQLLIIIPIVGFLVLLFFLVQDSEGDNQYGPDPTATTEE